MLMSAFAFDQVHWLILLCLLLFVALVSGHKPLFQFFRSSNTCSDAASSQACHDYQLLLNSEAHGVMLCNLQGEMLCNRFVHQLLGWPAGTPQPVTLLQSVLQAVHFSRLSGTIRQQQSISFPVSLAEIGFLLQGQPLKQPSLSGHSYIIRLLPLNERRLNPNFERICRHINEIEDAAAIVDLDLNICSVNQRFDELTGYSTAEVLSRNLTSLRSTENPADFYEALWQQVRDSGHFSGKVLSRDKEGRTFLHRLTISEILNDQGVVTHYLCIYGEVAESRPANLMSGDALSLATEHKRLDLLFRQRVMQFERFNLVLLNINRFSRIQQTQHAGAAHEVLDQLRLRLEKSCSAQDIIGRYGRDEFVILCPDSESYTESLLREIVRHLQQPIQLDDLNVFISVSMGVARYPEHAGDLSALINAAGIAMRGVANGENRVGYYRQALGDAAAKSLRMESLLRNAIDRAELSLHYQPIFNARCEMVKVEALLRWHSPELGHVSPGEFIPVAEQSSLIDKLGYWVIHEACRQHLAWRKEGLQIPIAINISSRQLREPAFAERLLRALRIHGVSPDQLLLEVTESALMEQLDAGADILQHLSDQGFSIAIDDFGTGYSSLAYLQRFPASTLKIDRSFIVGLVQNKDTRVLDSILQMARTLEKSVVVEGVENAAQLLYLQNRAVDQLQGFLLARPMPADRLLSDYQNRQLLVHPALQVSVAEVSVKSDLDRLPG
ncbi:GGDEF domain-containing phosphodiesterase [Neptuniibacter sp. CAU 1671]|uniref:GGDEF domain-containing phosphodiesterase n=1 Tax=Neptuniibacter sp. CAU 1671 TaxID=3032593 RepID=UPI0023DB18FF|nr:GGDEF domain-containing phosphodiesterase [Neptuniibacter sp. CAU 1671]MDF2182902.1 EAL domain-containing protein [Neptuniibacter sp. CAU 1671]